jgi:hypothetical protein
VIAAGARDDARLGAPLLRLAARVLADVPPALSADAVAAVRAFSRDPSPARYLAATRVLRSAHHRHKLGLLGHVVGTRRTDHGLEVLARGAGLAPELMEALRALPADARNGRRLAIISDLLTAYRLVESRASGALAQWQRALGPVPRLGAADRRQKRRNVRARARAPSR